MNVFKATLSTETNTFSPIPTGLADFQKRDFYRRDGSRYPPVKGNTALIVWRDLAEADGHTVHEGVCTSAQPGGITTRHAYETLRGMLMDDLCAAGPLELVLLSLHGAMVADGTDDCEGDIIAGARATAGPRATIGVLLDLHHHLTERMRTSADIMVPFKKYPHTDKLDRVREVYALSRDAAQGRGHRGVDAVARIGELVGGQLTEPLDAPVIRMVLGTGFAPGRRGAARSRHHWRAAPGR